MRGQGIQSNAKIRLFHVITTLEAGGAQTQLRMLSEHLSADRYEIAVSFLNRVPTLAPASWPAHVEVLDLTRDGRFDPAVGIRLARILRRRRPELVHTHLVHAGLVGRAAARMAGVRTLITTRHYTQASRKGAWTYRLEDRLTRRSTVVVAVSEAVRRYLIEHGIAPEDRIQVIPPGIDVELYRRSGTIDPEAAGSDSGVVSRSAAVRLESASRPCIGAVARHHPIKGVDVLIQAVAVLAKQGLRVDLELVGAGPQSEALRGLAQGLDLTSHVRFLGWIDPARVPARLAGWDLFVMPSRREAFGIAALEAMAASVPVVATRIDGLEELVDGCGTLAPPDDPTALAEAIRKALTEPAETRAKAQRALERVESEHTIQKTANRFDALYRSVSGR